MQVENGFKELEFGKESRENLLKGVKILYDAVKVTLGPRGKNVVIERKGGPPLVTKDGVTVAKSINLRDKFANLGVQIIKEAASRSCDVAGDGTTTSTVLTYSIFSEGQKLLSAGFSPLEMKQGIQDSAKLIVDEIKRSAIPISGKQDVESVGTISANGEKEIGKLLNDAISLVGLSGIITIEDAKGFETSLTITEGAEIDRGYISPYFVTNQGKMIAEMDNPFVLVTNKKISSMRQLLPLLEKILDANKSLLIIADEVEGEALQGLVMNKAKGIVNVCAIKAPEFGDNRVPALEDLACLFGCQMFIGDDNELMKIQLSDLGKCEKAIVHKNKTIVIRPHGKIEDVEKRAADLRENLNNPLIDSHTKNVLNRRLSRLAGSIAVIRVGGSTESEVQERKDRVEDALHAVKAAIEFGIVPGGGTALVRASRSLKNLGKRKGESYLAGVEIIRRACVSPLSQILKNAEVEPSQIISKIQSSKGDVVYNAATHEFCNPFKAGIIDPAKVVLSSFEHATSSGLILLSVGATITDDNEELT